MSEPKKPKKELEGGRAGYWGDDIDSEVDDLWLAEVTKLLQQQPDTPRTQRVIKQLKRRK